jgi:hypothetical protein
MNYFILIIMNEMKKNQTPGNSLLVTGVVPGSFIVHEQDHGGNIYLYQNRYATEKEARNAAFTAWYYSGSVKYAWISQEIVYY